MKRFILTGLAFLFSIVAFAQNFPDAQKQPKQKEMRQQHQKFRKQAIRHHHKMKTTGGSAYRRKR